MKRSSFAMCALIGVLFCALSLSTLAAPRATAPKNDNFAAAKMIKLGGKATVKNIGAATEEVGEPSICGADAFNTVWYTVRAEVDFPHVFISTAGSYLPHLTAASADVSVAIYTGFDITDLTEVACRASSIGQGFAELDFSGNWGETYYIQIGTPEDIDFDAASFYRLTTKIIDMRPFPPNSSFEQPIAADNWQVKKGGVDDVIVCDNLDFPAFTESCAFRFAGGPNEKTVLTQTVAMPQDIVYSTSHMLIVGGVAQVFNAPAVEKAKFTLTLKYKDGTAATSVAYNLAGITAGDYIWFRVLAPLKSKALASYTLKFQHKSTSGDLVIDNIFVNYHGGAAIRDAALPLPLPPR